MSFRQTSASASLSNALGDFLYTTAAASYGQSEESYSHNPVPSSHPVHDIRTPWNIASNNWILPPMQLATAGSGIMRRTEQPQASQNSAVSTEPPANVSEDDMTYSAGASGTWPMGTEISAYTSKSDSCSQWNKSGTTNVYEDTAQEGCLTFEFYTGPEDSKQSGSALPKSPNQSVSNKEKSQNKSTNRNGPGSQKKRSCRKTRANKRSQKSGCNGGKAPPAASKSRKQVKLPSRGAAPGRNPDGTYKVRFTANLSGNCTKHARTPRFRGEVIEFVDGGL